MTVNNESLGYWLHRYQLSQTRQTQQSIQQRFFYRTKIVRTRLNSY
jgi:hypothetical protein